MHRRYRNSWRAANSIDCLGDDTAMEFFSSLFIALDCGKILFACSGIPIFNTQPCSKLGEPSDKRVFIIGDGFKMLQKTIGAVLEQLLEALRIKRLAPLFNRGGKRLISAACFVFFWEEGGLGSFNQILFKLGEQVVEKVFSCNDFFGNVGSAFIVLCLKPVASLGRMSSDMSSRNSLKILYSV